MTRLRTFIKAHNARNSAYDVTINEDSSDAFTILMAVIVSCAGAAFYFYV